MERISDVWERIRMKKKYHEIFNFLLLASIEYK